MIHDEKAHLERISNVSLYAAGANSATIKYSFKVAERFLVGENLLEMGPAEGVMTELLATTGKRMTLVEGSGLFCEDLRKRFPQANVVHALFEEFQPSELFDNIILGHVLEHVQDPVDILSRARHWLKPGTGRLFAAVPNARSLHRQAAVIMGMLKQEDALNEMDIHHGHRRVFNPESYRNAFYQAGFASRNIRRLLDEAGVKQADRRELDAADAGCVHAVGREIPRHRGRDLCCCSQQ